MMSLPPSDAAASTPTEGVVMERLAGVLGPDSARAWLSTPNPLLSNRPPVVLLVEGRHAEVLAVIDQMGEGVFL